MDQLDTLLRQLPTLPYATDGIVFTPVNEPVAIGTAEKTFKLKSRHTVDLEVRGGALYVGQGGAPTTAVQRVGLCSVGITLTPTTDFWSQVSAACSTHSIEEPMIIECELMLNEDCVELHFLNVRNDKAHPNAVRTILGTVINLRENIIANELCFKKRGTLTETSNAPPKPMGNEAAAQGGAELANVAVGDALGAPFEFISVVNDVGSSGAYFDVASFSHIGTDKAPEITIAKELKGACFCYPPHNS